MQFYLRNSRFGTIIHTFLYLFGIPVFYNNLEDAGNNESILRDYGLNSNATVNSTLTRVVGPLEKCYGLWGCFKPKYPELRGFHLFPDPIEDVNPSICLYTSASCESCQIVEGETIQQLRLPNKHNVATKSYWVIHGYMENGNRPWIKEMACKLLKEDATASVFVLDWAEGAKPPYTQAVVNLELLAVYTGTIMKELEKLYDLKYSNIHIIGHSLGAHLAGCIGSWLITTLNEKLARISGLDPAQPHFQDLPVDARLSLEDAFFVDIIHTDARPLMDGGNLGVGLGIQSPIGHADFFPNNGKEQPGCKDGVYNAILLEDGSFLYGIRRFLGCDHMRAYEYFTESIGPLNVPCKFIGYACPSWDTFITARCVAVPTNRMGFHAFKPNEITSYYLVTGSKSSFCRDHFIVTINLAHESSYRSNSDLHLVLGDGKRETATLIFDWTDLRGGNLTYTYLREGLYIPPINKLILRPAMSNPLLWWMNRMAPKNSDLTLTSMSILHLEENQIMNETTLFCPEGSSSFSISDQNPHINLVPRTSTNQCE